MRPGQVHRLVLKAGSTGHIVQFKADFLATSEPGARVVGEVVSRRWAPEACLQVGRFTSSSFRPVRKARRSFFNDSDHPFTFLGSCRASKMSVT